MRYLVGILLGILETLLALGCFAMLVSQLIGRNFGVVDLAADLLMTATGLWLANKAIANFKAKPGLGQA